MGWQRRFDRFFFFVLFWIDIHRITRMIRQFVTILSLSVWEGRVGERIDFAESISEHQL